MKKNIILIEKQACEEIYRYFLHRLVYYYVKNRKQRPLHTPDPAYQELLHSDSALHIPQSDVRKRPDPAHAMEPDFPYQPLSSVLLALQNFLIILLPLRLSPRKVSGKNLLFLLLMQYIQLRKHCFVDDPAMSVRHCRLPFCPVPHPRTRLITNKRNIF